MTTFSIIIPTAGGDRSDLPWVIHSLMTQKLVPGDEILIVGDGPQQATQDLIDAMGPPFRYIQGPHTGDWGHSQINHAIPIAKGNFILVQDDDDGYLPRALETVRETVSKNGPVPHIFRFYTNNRLLRWLREDENKVASGLLGGHNIVCPNIPGRRGEGAWSPEYRGDYPWVEAVLNAYPRRDHTWCLPILTCQRPDKTLLDWPVKTDKEFEILRVLRNECREDLTQMRDEITPEMQQAFQARIEAGEPIRPYIFTHRETKEYVGWNLTRLHDGKVWPSYGIAKAYRGRGMSRLIVQHALDAAMDDTYVESFAHNEAILHVQKSLGFIETGRRETPIGTLVDLFRPYP